MDEHTQKPAWGKASFGSFSAPAQLAFIHQVYGWMAGGLSISALVALFVASTPAVAAVILGNQLVFFGIILAELGAVIFLSVRLEKMSVATAATTFLGYSALNGLTLSAIFFAYSLGSISGIFLLTGVLFAGIALYGYFTKTDLTTIGSFAGMALFGLILVMVMNLFFKNAQINTVLAGIGVLIFTVLAAYDTQKLKWLYHYSADKGAGSVQRAAIQGALALYLDFINLFLELLQLFGKRR